MTSDGYPLANIVTKVERAIGALHSIRDAKDLDYVEREMVQGQEWDKVLLDLYAIQSRLTYGSGWSTLG